MIMKLKIKDLILMQAHILKKIKYTDITNENLKIKKYIFITFYK